MNPGKWLARGRRALCKIHLVDKCLLAFMAVLMLQSAYSLIFSGGAFPESNNIDVIVRTSAAAIFGYFLSANFIRHAVSDQNEGDNVTRQIELKTDATTSGSTPQARIGFAAPDAPATPETGGIDTSDHSSESADAACLQTLTAAAIGLFCLIVLILVRNFAPWDDTVSPTVTATVAQLRDFVSGSVGFLLGSPTSGTNAKG